MGSCCSGNIGNSAEIFIQEIFDSFTLSNMDYFQFIDLVNKFDALIEKNEQRDSHTMTYKKKVLCFQNEVLAPQVSQSVKKHDATLSDCSNDSSKTSKLINESNKETQNLAISIELDSDCGANAKRSNKPALRNTISAFHITRSNFRSKFENFIIDNLLNKNSPWFEYQKFLIPMSEQITVSTYKLHLIAWAFGILKCGIPNSSFSTKADELLHALNYIYDNNVNQRSICEFINLYLNYNTVKVNEIVIRHSMFKYNTIINGHLLNSEFLSLLKHLKDKIYVSGNYRIVYRQIVSLFDSKKENAKSSGIHLASKELCYFDTLVIDKASLNDFLNVKILREHILTEYLKTK